MCSNEIKEDQKQMAAERRACQYAILSRLFADQTTGADIGSYLGYLELPAGEPDSPAAAFSLKLRQWLEKENPDHLLKTEYARLFILAGGIRPYESVYRGEGAMLMQEPWVKVKQFYQKCGLKLENPARHPEDHASAEFSFMLYLLEKADMSAAQEFFRQHLYRWIPRMFADIIEYPYADFFRDAAIFGQSFMESEQACFGEDTA